MKDIVDRAKMDIHFFARYILNIKRPTWQQATMWDMVQAAQFGWPAPLPRLPHRIHGGKPAPVDKARAVAQRQIAIASGQGPGKTFGSTVVMAWRQFRSDIKGKSVVTAPGMRQCQTVWLAEFRKIARNAHPLFQALVTEITATKVVFGNDPNWVIHCVTSSDEKKLQGFHDDGMTILIEEFSGVLRRVVEQFQGTLSNQDCMLIGIGNPNIRDCAMFDAFSKDLAEWQTYRMDAEDTALWRPDIVAPERNERLAKTYGKDSDVYRIRVKGLFPKTDPDSVFDLDLLNAAKANDKYKCATANNDKVIAIDFARMGSNETAIYQRKGNAIIDYKIYNRVEPGFAVAEAFRMQEAAGWTDEETLFVPDATGMGQGVLWMFYANNKKVYEFHSGGKPNNSRAFANRGTESWFCLRERMKNYPVHIPDDDRLIAQLVGRKYKPTEKGQFKLESKQEYAKRISGEDSETSDSPDRADGITMVFYDHAIGTAQHGSVGQEIKGKTGGVSSLWHRVE